VHVRDEPQLLEDVRLEVLRAPRGAIYDRNGVLLADSAPSFSVVFRPFPAESLEFMRLVRSSDWVRRVADVLHADTADVRRLVATASSTGQSVMLRRNAPFAVRAAVEETRDELPGIDVFVEPLRHYPHGTLAAHLLGYAGEINDVELDSLGVDGYRSGDLIGRSGVERSYEEILRGQDGAEFEVVNAAGQRVSTLTEGRRGCRSAVTISSSRSTCACSRHSRTRWRTSIARRRRARPQRRLGARAREPPGVRSQRILDQDHARSLARAHRRRREPAARPRDPGHVSAGLDVQGGEHARRAAHGDRASRYAARAPAAATSPSAAARSGAGSTTGTAASTSPVRSSTRATCTSIRSVSRSGSTPPETRAVWGSATAPASTCRRRSAG
jgi:hypothetical protein